MPSPLGFSVPRIPTFLHPLHPGFILSFLQQTNGVTYKNLRFAVMSKFMLHLCHLLRS